MKDPVGWRDRDWAELDDAERDVLYGSRTLRTRTTRGRRLGALGAAAAVAVAAWVALGHPGVAGLGLHGTRLAAAFASTKEVTAPPPPVRIGGSGTAQYRSIYTLRGRTGGPSAQRVTGTVKLRGRWNHGAWTELARSRTDTLGRYHLSTTLLRRGLLELELQTPDGARFTKTLRVS